MRPPRVRITVRGLMVLVALVAAFVGGERMLARGESYRRRSAEHAAAAKAALGHAADFASFAAAERESARDYRDRAAFLGPEAESWAARNLEGAEYDEEAAAVYRKSADYHSDMQRKWEQAARLLWISVAPDPPDPVVADLERLKAKWVRPDPPAPY